MTSPATATVPAADPAATDSPAAGRARPGTVLVTGSLYLVGNVRANWYPDDAIARHRTPWPRAIARSGE